LPFEIDTARAFAALFGGAEATFWLDGGLGDPEMSRFSFLGSADGPWSEVLQYRVESGLVRVRDPHGSSVLPGTIFDVLERRLADRVVRPAELPLPFAAGYVGYFGYEVKADCGSPNKNTTSQPDAAWIFADRVIVVDHLNQHTYVLATIPDDADPAASATWISETSTKLACFKDGDDDVPAEPIAADVEPWLARSRSQYLADVENCLDALRAGDSYEICLTNTALMPTTVEPLAHYRTMRRRNLGRYSSFLRFGTLSIASSSPECFLRIDADGVIESKPIKGTVARDADPVADALIRDQLAADPKARAENLMIVDLLRNDLGRVSSVGSVVVSSLMEVETYANVHHLVSTIRGRKREDVTSVKAVQHCFPAGSMTGAPKLEIIGELENRARGPYSGALGYFSATGAVDLSVVIRTAVFDGSAVSIGAGGAIVLDSLPEQEFAEMLTKMETPLAGRPFV
jgi:para-aminobenzoate synthetase